MKRSTIAVLALVVALLVSNGWWAYQMLDSGVSFSYLQDEYRYHRRALTTALAVLPVVAQPAVTPDEVVEAAIIAADGSEPFEKEGFIWVGQLGFQFGPDGRLVSVAPAWSPY